MQTILSILTSLHFHPVVFFVVLVSFTLFHFAMRVVIYDPMIAARNERDGRIHGFLSKAEAAAANAKSMKVKYEEEIRSQRLALSQELKDAIDGVEKQVAAMMQTARDEAGRLTEDANSRLDEEEKQLKAGMDDQAAKLALAVAQRIVRNSLAEGAQDRVLAQLKG